MNIALFNFWEYNEFAKNIYPPSRKEKKAMNKTNIKCPRCHSEKLYKFGFDKQANQKYQCKECGRQFAPDSVSSRPKSKYPRCP